MSKKILSFGLLCVLIKIGLSKDFENGTLTYNRNLAVQSGYDIKCAVGDSIICKDCNTLLICNGEGIELAAIACEESNPYCSTNSCTNVPSNECDVGPSFTCTSDGYMPDPVNCRRYYYCSTAGVVQQAYDCPYGFYVDTTDFRCKTDTCSNKCDIMTCPGTKPLIFIEHPTNKQFYGFCTENSSIPVMFSCGKGYEFNSETKRCDYKCPGDGFFPGRTDTAYVFCYRCGEDYRFAEYDCPTGLVYDRNQNYCM